MTRINWRTESMSWTDIMDIFNILITGVGVLAFLLLALGLLGFVALQKGKKSREPSLKVIHYNKKLLDDLLKITKETSQKLSKEIKNKFKKVEKEIKKNVYVIDFHGDIEASQATQLQNQVNYLEKIVKEDDEIILRLFSMGGHVHGYGLATAHLERLKKKKVKINICVDKIAASGGYMMACVADKLICAPFAIIGSVGVVANIPNVNKALKKMNIEYLELTAGEYKRTLTPLGEITEKGKEKFIEQLEDTHGLFKEHIFKHRPNLDMSKVATGEFWFGLRAHELNLVDSIMTSEEFLLSFLETANIYGLHYEEKTNFKTKLRKFLKLTLAEVQSSKIENQKENNYNSICS